MTTTMIALLRGINVGRAKRVAMADLRSLVSELGFSDVRSVLNSGNLIFADDSGAAPATVAARIESAVDDRFGLDARVVVLTAAELAELVASNPLGAVADNPSRLHVALLARSAHRTALEPLAERVWRPEALALGERCAYLWCPAGVLKSALPKAVESAVGAAVTMRTWATALKILAKC